jgi:hypothetical protein
MAFIDVLVDVLDCLHRDTDFNIYVTVILGTEERIVWNNITISECVPGLSLLRAMQFSGLVATPSGNPLGGFDQDKGSSRGSVHQVLGQLLKVVLK